MFEHLYYFFETIEVCIIVGGFSRWLCQLGVLSRDFTLDLLLIIFALIRSLHETGGFFLIIGVHYIPIKSETVDVLRKHVSLLLGILTILLRGLVFREPPFEE